MTPAMKRERERRTVEEIDNVIREQLVELRANLAERHHWPWRRDYKTARYRYQLCEQVRRHCRMLRTQLWIQQMTLRGHANFLGLTR